MASIGGPPVSFVVGSAEVVDVVKFVGVVEFVGVSVVLQDGRGVPASSHVTVLRVSWCVHLSVAPSVHARLCCWDPSPQVGSAPLPTQSPMFSHSPKTLVPEVGSVEFVVSGVGGSSFLLRLSASPVAIAAKSIIITAIAIAIFPLVVNQQPFFELLSPDNGSCSSFVI